MELNNRIRRLRKKLGYPDLESFIEILYEDFSEDEMEALKQNYLQIEKGSRPVDVKLLQLILKKFPSVNPKWLLNGIGQFDDPTDPSRAYDVRQINSGSADTHNRLEIVERDSPLKDKIIADKEAQIEELEKSVAHVAKTLTNHPHKESSSISRPIRIQIRGQYVAVAALLFVALVVVYVFNPNDKSSDLPHNAYYESLISENDREFYKDLTHEKNDYGFTFKLDNFEGISLRIENHQQRKIFEQDFIDNELSVYALDWKPGKYYFFLLKDDKQIFVNSLTKY